MWEPVADAEKQHQEQQQQKEKEQQLDNNCGQIDSGFLSSDQILSGYSEADDEDLPSASVNVPPPSVDQKKQEVEVILDSGLVEDVEVEFSQQGNSTSDMLLEREVDNGLAEWLCTLDLKQQNQQQHSGINNLSRRVDSTTASLDQLNIGEKEQHRHIPEQEQPWERFYKQDADGDT